MIFPISFCSQCRTVLFAFDDVLELEGTIESLFCAWGSSKGETYTRTISPPDRRKFGCGMLWLLWNALSGRRFLPRHNQPAFLCIFNHLQLIKCHDFLQIFNAKGAILSSSSQSSFLSSPSSFWGFPFSRPLRSKVGFEPRLPLLPFCPNPFPDSTDSPYFPASGAVTVLAAAHWDRKHLECKHQSLSWWDAFIFPKSSRNVFILALQNQNRSAVQIGFLPGHYRLGDIQKNYSPWNIRRSFGAHKISGQIRRCSGFPFCWWQMSGICKDQMTGKDGKIVKNRGDLMNRSAVSLDVLQDLDPFPWWKWHQVQIGLCHTMRFLIRFCLSLLSTLTACPSLWSKEILTSCGSLLGITAEVRPMQFRNCLKNAAGENIISTLKRLQGPTDPLGVWHSNSLDQWNIEWFKFWWEYSRSTQQHRSWSTLA